MAFNLTLGIDMNKIILVLIVSAFSMFFFNSTTLAQETANTKKVVYIDEGSFQDYDNKIGFAASMFSGIGISYQRHIQNGFRIEFTASIYGSGGEKSTFEGSKSSDMYYTIGMEIQKVLYNSQEAKMYVFAGTSYWFDKTNYIGPQVNSIYSIYDENYVFGLGVGFQYSISSQIILDIEGGYLYRESYETDSREQPDDGTYYLGFGIAAGVYFAF